MDTYCNENAEELEEYYGVVGYVEGKEESVSEEFEEYYGFGRVEEECEFDDEYVTVSSGMEDLELKTVSISTDEIIEELKGPGEPNEPDFVEEGSLMVGFKND